jgi:Ca2+-binding RTX toxin-like protein
MFQLLTLISALLGHYEVPLSSVAVPTQCSAHYDHAFVVPAGASFTGTSKNDLIFAGDASSVHGGSGDDCIVLSSRVSAHGDAGNDTFVSNGNQNSIHGDAGNDTAYYHDQDSLHSVENPYQL